MFHPFICYCTRAVFSQQSSRAVIIALPADGDWYARQPPPLLLRLHTSSYTRKRLYLAGARATARRLFIHAEAAPARSLAPLLEGNPEYDIHIGAGARPMTPHARRLPALPVVSV